jgi:hypothetical protein
MRSNLSWGVVDKDYSALSLASSPEPGQFGRRTPSLDAFSRRR